jgi:hypothetical protein
VNAVEIEDAISVLAEQPFDAQGFPFAFLQAFGNKETTLKRLRSGASNWAAFFRPTTYTLLSPRPARSPAPSLR